MRFTNFIHIVALTLSFKANIVTSEHRDIGTSEHRNIVSYHRIIVSSYRVSRITGSSDFRYSVFLSYLLIDK
ncbi:hypothetical protein B7494_g1593 [Chlorociboria aeruginascens]|nr:hypothetical protein B7494_g1593 [Chlorociboria aeruginascens]